MGDAHGDKHREDGLVQLRPRDPRICRGHLEHRADTQSGSRRMTVRVAPTLDAATLSAIVDGRHGDPFAVLGPHEVQGKLVVRAFVPAATGIAVIDPESGAVAASLDEVAKPGLFEGIVPDRPAWFGYRLRATNAGGSWEFDDPYRFPPVLGEMDDYLMREGTHRRLWESLGGRAIRH